MVFPVRKRTSRGTGSPSYLMVLLFIALVVTSIWWNRERKGDREISSFGSMGNSTKPGILVIFSGPLYLSDPKNPDLNQLYLTNLEWFLKHGIDCRNHDTIIVVGESVFPSYNDYIEVMDATCQFTNHRIKLVHRSPECDHMGSMSLIAHGDFIESSHFSSFIFITSQMSGPHSKQMADGTPWMTSFTSRLGGTVRAVGLSHVCDGMRTHFQENVYAVDRLGFDILRRTIVDCEATVQQTDHADPNWRTRLASDARHFPIAMSQAIMNTADYTLTSILREPVTPIDKTSRLECVADDLWTVSNLNKTFGKLPNWQDVMFYKTSRYLPEDIATTIGFKGNITWKWR